MRCEDAPIGATRLVPRATEGEKRMAVHLTPSELADEMHMKRREVLSKCIEMNVPVLKGRIDKTLFQSSLRALQRRDKQATA